MRNEKTITIAYQEFAALSDLDHQARSLCESAAAAMSSSHSPYSHFRVGAALRLSNGVIISGSNQENVAYPSGLCAERVALFSAGAAYPDQAVLSMAITAHTDHFKILSPVTSCGACLQVMAEYEKKHSAEIEVLFYCIGGPIIRTKGIKSLLPFAFEETRLGKIS